MRIGVGLPAGIPATNGSLLLEWARRADAGSFSSLGVIERIAYDSYDPMLALAAAAAVTERVRLATVVLIAPLRRPALLAKEAASLDALSGGRLTLGLGIGGRLDDYELSGVTTRFRGRQLTEHLEFLRSYPSLPDIGPQLANSSGFQLLVGGRTAPALARMAHYADGYVHAGGPERSFVAAAEDVHTAWLAEGRSGNPALWSMAYFSLSDPERGERYLRHYYAFTGDFVEKILASHLQTTEAVRELLRAYEDAGCDELVLMPTVADLSELDLLAEAIA